ncbi:hypothetical protein INT45_014216 [Circinella minor]|uniref:DUF202 domain-containing protein n=1 Tax=Circinella minor TaxID=1195481 RepID=A0A8H7SBW5_9FUNG|nr:hypothetical protein INT45_014216 [Circinella minor]
MSSRASSVETGQKDSSKGFVLCSNEYCSDKFKHIDWVIHTKVDGPDPRDHFASERTFLSWLRTGMTLALIDFQQLSKPTTELPWAHEPLPTKQRILAYIFVGLGFLSLLVSLVIYFKNQHRIVNRLLNVGNGWAGYSMALLIMLFVCFVMAVAITES